MCLYMLNHSVLFIIYFVDSVYYLQSSKHVIYIIVF